MNPQQLAGAAEASVVALAATGDDKAFAELVRRRQGMVRDLMRRLCGDRAFAEDLAQQTFVRAWRQLGEGLIVAGGGQGDNARLGRSGERLRRHSRPAVLSPPAKALATRRPTPIRPTREPTPSIGWKAPG